MDKYILGIDFGTTSVKASIINVRNNRVESYYVKDTQAQIPYPAKVAKNKQDVSKIISAMNFAVSKLSKQYLSQVSRIGICCQMHGVVLWNNDGLKQSWVTVEKDKNYRYDVVPENVSGLYTWQDARCDNVFLTTLPIPISHINIASGFGLCTLFWIQRNEPEKLLDYQCAGTIGDFAVSMLCDMYKPLMSEQNAASWGYFDCSTMTWNRELLRSHGFPVRFLPDVAPAGTVAGYLTENWHTIPGGVPIGVAMGDIQCSILSCLESPKDAVLSITTSAQITFIANKFTPTKGPPERGYVAYYPYFNHSYIAVAASLNGGNSLATFVKMLQQWSLELGYSMPQSKVWDKVLSLAIDQNAQDSDLFIRPTCLGERNNPDMTGEILNITPDSLHLGGVFRAICYGVIHNLHEMLPTTVLRDAKITRILGNGKGLSRNPVLQKYVETVFDLPLVMAPGVETSTGAAIAMSGVLDSSHVNKDTDVFGP